MEYGSHILESGRAFALLRNNELRSVRLGACMARTSTSLLFSAGKIGRRYIAVEVPVGIHNDEEIMAARLRASYLGGSILHDMYPRFADHYVPKFIGKVSVTAQGPSAFLMHDMTSGNGIPLQRRLMSIESGTMLEWGAAGSDLRQVFGKEVRNSEVMYGEDAADYFVETSEFVPANGSLLAGHAAYVQASKTFDHYGSRAFRTLEPADPLAMDIMNVYLREQQLR